MSKSTIMNTHRQLHPDEPPGGRTGRTLNSTHDDDGRAKDDDTYGFDFDFDLERQSHPSQGYQVPSSMTMMMWAKKPSVLIRRGNKDAMSNNGGEESQDDRDNFSFEAGTADEVSTLGESMILSTAMDPRLPPPTAPPANQVTHRSHSGTEVPLRELSIHRKAPAGVNKHGGKALIIRMVGTEDTSQGTATNATPPKDESARGVRPGNSLKSSQKQPPPTRRGFPVRRFIYIISVVMGPILLGAMIVLIFLFVRMRQGEHFLSSNSNHNNNNNNNNNPNNKNQGAGLPFPNSGNTIVGFPSTGQPSLTPAPQLFVAVPTPPPTVSSTVPTRTPTSYPTTSTTTNTTTNTSQPTVQPTRNPTAAPSVGTPTSTPTAAPSTAMPTSMRPPRPDFRYRPWQQVLADSNTLQLASLTSGLGYNASSWNMPGTLSLERWSYSNALTNGGPYVEFSLKLVGFNSPVQWNCWINHYMDFTWAELGNLTEMDGSFSTVAPQSSQPQQGQPGSMTTTTTTVYGQEIQSAYQTLGWTPNTWGTQDPTQRPNTWSKQWKNLSPQEQDSAEYLCYTQELWDRVPLPQW